MKDWKLRKRGAGYAVIDGAGTRVSPVYRTAEAALDWVAKRARARAPQERACLCCGRGFDSRGIHDRLCRWCDSPGSGRVSS